jgi:hypothetical protein
MATQCSFSDDHVGALLASSPFQSDDSALREHTAGCPFCALRVAAAERLAARQMRLGCVPGSDERPLQQKPNSRLRSRRTRRSVTTAALSLAAVFVMLTFEHAPLLGSQMAPDQDVVSTRAEDTAKALAPCGSPIPGELIPRPAELAAHPPGTGLVDVAELFLSRL